MEHLAGKGIDRIIRFIHSRRLKRWTHDSAPFSTKESLRRFSLLATAVTGRDLRVVDLKGDPPPRPYLPILHKMAHPALLADHGFAWSDGEAIFLPVSLIDMRSIAEQERIATIIIFFLSLQIRHGSLKTARLNRKTLEGDTLLADLYWIIENTRLFHILRNDFPGLMRDWEELSGRLLSRRPAHGQINHVEKKVEEFLRDSLKGAVIGEAASGSATPKPGSAYESLLAAKELKERWAAEGLPIRRFRAMVPFTPWGRLIPGKVKDSSDPGLGTDVKKEQEKKSREGGELGEEDGRKEAEEKKDRNRYMTREEEVNEEANERGLMLNIYDKIISWAEFVNVERPFDDEPDGNNAKKADEMEELTTAKLERSTTTRFDADLERADNHRDEDEAKIEEAVYLYPEWDFRRQGYRKDFSRVMECEAPAGPGGFVERVLKERCGLIKEVRRKFEMLTPESVLLSRQTDGVDIDIDAAVEAAVDLKAGRPPGEKLYLSYNPVERDLSVLFLVDLSMSTDAWINDKRVIDHEKEALVVLLEAMEKLRDNYAVYGFSGKTRKGCRFFRIKGFQEGYGGAVRKRIGGLVPHQYTRMGPAIRHAAGILRKQPSKAKLLFIISDGKPNDIDAYEGRYGIEDTRRAVKEAEGWGIVPFCLTVDTLGHEYLGRIFGAGNHAVLSGVDRLLRKLPELYARIVKSL
jgi:nitric oxide reductase NorD protein